MIRTRQFVASGLALATVLSIAPSIGAAQTERQSISGERVSIYNLAGRIRVERGTGSDVTVEVTRGGRDAGKLQLATNMIAGRNAFRVLYPDGDDIVYSDRPSDRGNSSSDIRIESDGTWGHNDRSGWRGKRVRVKTRGSGTEAWADLVVRVPSGKSVAVYLAGGEMSAMQVDADLRLDVSSARVTASDIKGQLDVDAGSGSVNLRGISGSHLTVDNGSGSVTMNDVTSDSCSIDTGSGGFDGGNVRCTTLRVDVGSGSVHVNSMRADDVTVETGSGSITLELLSSPSRLSVESGSGGVTLALPASFSATLDIETGSGGITTDFPVTTTRMERRHLRGTIGNGSGTVRIETGSGSVRLKKSIN